MKTMGVQEATRSYEGWMREHTRMIPTDLREKHAQMRKSCSLFFRGTFYRWVQLWPKVCSDLNAAPRVLSVGDLHVSSFGTWRDLEGRLCWGVDDFDEAYPLPYTSDLTRLAASAKIVIDAEELKVTFRQACRAIMSGYHDALRNGGHPIVLAEHEKIIEKLGIEDLKPPADFWGKLNRLPGLRNKLPAGTKKALESALPSARLDYKIVRRQAGLGSLGQERFVLIANWEGGFIAREAKASRPSACAWLGRQASRPHLYYQTAIASAIRSRDPFQLVVQEWIIRRLSPDSNPIEIETVSKHRDEERLLYAMGAEAANVHLGSKSVTKRIQNDLAKRRSNWLASAAKNMARATERDWREYKNS